MMSDLFTEKAQDWDANEMIKQLSTGIGNTILKQVDLNEDMRVLDFGAGTGLISAHVAPQVKMIKAVDTSAAMLEKLVAKPELSGKVKVMCQDITETPLNEKFDLIISAMAMHHVEDTEKLFKTFAMHLLPGGKVALADLDHEDGTFHPSGAQGVFHAGFERNMIQSILEHNGFSDIRFVTAHTVNKDDKSYPIFLVTATLK